MPNIDSIVQNHVTLQVECIDRLYLHGDVPGLQRPNQLAWFLTKHRGNPIASPALLGKMTDTFVASIKTFAESRGILIVQFKRGERKDEIAQRRLAEFRKSGREEGVIFIGVAKENVSAFRSTAKKQRDGSAPRFDFYRGNVCVNHYYFYILDRDWGPGFVKFCTYAPFGVRVCLNGHEWVKCQLTCQGIAFEALDNGFLSCAVPERLQTVCDDLDAEHVAGFCRKWLSILPHPLTSTDKTAGYHYHFSIWQMEFSLTQVFDRPIVGRQFFEELIRENLDLGRPDRIQILFGRRVTRLTPSTFRTRFVHQGDLPKLSVEYKSSRLKQYFKEGRALRTETTINNPYDVNVHRAVSNLPKLRDVSRDINRRLIETERTSHNCVIAPRTFESIVQPSITEGQRVPALRFGDPRVMALLSAWCMFVPAPRGVRNSMLRPHVAALLGHNYTTQQMTYDLRRLRLHGLIGRLPHSHGYVLTPIGRRVTLFFTKAYLRVFRPGLARIDPALPSKCGDRLADAWRDMDEAVDQLVREAKFAPNDESRRQSRLSLAAGHANF